MRTVSRFHLSNVVVIANWRDAAQHKLTALFCSMMLVFNSAALANELSNSSSHVAKPADIRILIDVSGSMKQNDPQNLRRAALDLLTQLVPEDSKAGVWTFGRYVNLLVPHNIVNEPWRSAAEPKSRLINSVALHTNIGLALDKANYDDNPGLFPSSKNYNKSVILLTDGVVDIASDPVQNEAERQRILSDILPAYQQADVAIHAVALSTNADVELLEELAQQTDGSFAVAEDASDLNRIFLNAFDRAAPADRIPMEDNRFLIDSSVEEFTALVFRQNGSAATVLQSPAGDRYDVNTEGASIRWFSSAEYDLITIKQPVEGEWKINADFDPENRVSVVSNLAMNVEGWPNNWFIGDTHSLIATLVEGGDPITDDRFLSMLAMRASLQQLVPDSTVLRAPVESNLERDFSRQGAYMFTPPAITDAGDYTATVLVDGKTFQREKTLKFTVRPSFQARLTTSGIDAQFTVTVESDNPAYDHQTVEIIAQIHYPDGQQETILLDSATNRGWSKEWTSQLTGDYSLGLSARRLVEASGGAVKDSMFRQSEEIDQFNFYLNVPGVAEPIIEIPEETESVTEPATEVAEEVADPVVDSIEQEISNEPAKVNEIVAEEQIAEHIEQESSPWMLYAGLALGNLALISLLTFFYFKLTRRPEGNQESSTGADEDSTAKQEEEPVAEVEEPLAEVEEEPLAEVEQEPLEEVEKEPSSDKDKQNPVEEEPIAPKLEVEEDVETDTAPLDEKALEESSAAAANIDEQILQPRADEEDAELREEVENMEVDLDAMLDVESEDASEVLAVEETLEEAEVTAAGLEDSGVEQPGDADASEDELEAILADIEGESESDEVENNKEQEENKAGTSDEDLETELVIDELLEEQADFTHDIDALDEVLNEELDDESEVSLDFDEEFDLSSDVSEEVKRSSGG